MYVEVKGLVDLPGTRTEKSSELLVVQKNWTLAKGGLVLPSVPQHLVELQAYRPTEVMERQLEGLAEAEDTLLVRAPLQLSR